VGSKPRPARARMTASAMFLRDADHLTLMFSTESETTGTFLSRRPTRSIPRAAEDRGPSGLRDLVLEDHLVLVDLRAHGGHLRP